MAGFSSQQRAFISTLAGHTGLDPGVVAAWVAAEEPVGASSGFHGSQNWLNIGITDSGPMGAGNAMWRDPVQAAVATANWIKGTWSDPGFGKASPGIQAIARTAGQSPGAQLRAIQGSGWASSGYPDLGQLYGTYRGQAPRPAAGGGGMASPSGGGGRQQRVGFSSLVPTTKLGFDQAGYGQAQKDFVLGSYLSNLGKSNPYDIHVKGEANFSNPLLASGLATTTAPNPADFMTAQTVLQKVAGSGLVNVNPGTSFHGVPGPGHGGYVNPIPGAVIGQTDMGVDINLKPGSPVRAIGDSKVLGIIPNWYQGQPYYAFQLLNGPHAGQPYYIAEQFAPRVKPGQTVRAGQAVGTYASSGTGIEIGWANPHNWQQTLSQAHGTQGNRHGPGGTPEGQSFRSFLGGLH